MQLDEVMLDKLKSWFETYNPDSMLYGFDIDEEDEELMYKDYQELVELLGRAKRVELTDDDVDVISFHLDCIANDDSCVSIGVCHLCTQLPEVASPVVGFTVFDLNDDTGPACDIAFVVVGTCLDTVCFDSVLS